VKENQDFDNELWLQSRNLKRMNTKIPGMTPASEFPIFQKERPTVQSVLDKDKKIDPTDSSGKALGMGAPSTAHGPKGPEEAAPSVSQGVFTVGPRLDDKDKQDKEQMAKDGTEFNYGSKKHQQGTGINVATNMDASQRDPVTGGAKMGINMGNKDTDSNPRGTRGQHHGVKPKPVDHKSADGEHDGKSSGIGYGNHGKPEGQSGERKQSSNSGFSRGNQQIGNTAEDFMKGNTAMGNIADTNEKQSPSDRTLHEKPNWEKLNESGDQAKLGKQTSKPARDSSRSTHSENLQNPQKMGMGAVGSVQEMESPNLNKEIPSPKEKTPDERSVTGRYGKTQHVRDSDVPSSDDQWKPL